MGFEKVVLNVVSEVLQKDNTASFTCGTLFVACDESDARSVFHRLSRDFGLGKVQIHGPIQGEFAYDFV
jgi:predicted dinucleotide-binding enzyme